MAWGINEGLLEKSTYLPVVQKAWDGLNAQVSSAGKLGYVQLVGAGPAAATADSTVEYGVGAYLLAGSEVAKLLPWAVRHRAHLVVTAIRCRHRRRFARSSCTA
jgi:unsaturated rhamnogalacturonyl hydrolase